MVLIASSSRLARAPISGFLFSPCDDRGVVRGTLGEASPNSLIPRFRWLRVLLEGMLFHLGLKGNQELHFEGPSVRYPDG